MPKITVSKELYTRVAEFKQVIEAVVDQEMGLDNCVELILRQGIDSMLADLLGPQDPETLLNSIQQLGLRHPTQVYGYIAEILKKGAATQEQERMRRQLGFRPQTKSDDETS